MMKTYPQCMLAETPGYENEGCSHTHDIQPVAFIVIYSRGDCEFEGSIDLWETRGAMRMLVCGPLWEPYDQPFVKLVQTVDTYVISVNFCVLCQSTFVCHVSHNFHQRLALALSHPGICDFFSQS